jgi:hypothetical protein
LWADEPIIFAIDSPKRKRLKRPAVKEKVAMDLRLRELCSEVDLLSTTTYVLSISIRLKQKCDEDIGNKSKQKATVDSYLLDLHLQKKPGLIYLSVTIYANTLTSIL